jgi:hypothetical protein
MFIQYVFERINRWCIYNIFWQFIPVFCYSNAEGVFSDVSVCSIISFKNILGKHWKDEELYCTNYKADISGSHVTYREIEEIQESDEEKP